MKILISGGTGFIGTRLCQYLSDEHELTVLTRKSSLTNDNIRIIDTFSKISRDEVFDIVINLAGEPIADKRWSAEQKKRMIDSRLSVTGNLISYFQEAKQKPLLFISGSAIGFYGIASSNEPIDENQAGDDSFSSILCQKWEQSALQAQSLGIRTCILRTGIVLGKNGGALEKILPPFKLGLGGKMGSGAQWMPWIHITDMIGIINYCIDNTTLKGAINCTAPEPVNNMDFSTRLAKALKRPSFFTMPSFVVRMLMGEMGKELLLSGKKIIPSKLLDAGYDFKYKNLDAALAEILDHAD